MHRVLSQNSLHRKQQPSQILLEAQPNKKQIVREIHDLDREILELQDTLLKAMKNKK